MQKIKEALVSVNVGDNLVMMEIENGEEGDKGRQNSGKKKAPDSPENAREYCMIFRMA